MQANTFKTNQKKEEEKTPAKKRSIGIGKAVRQILGTDKLTESTFRLFPFVLFIALIAFIYIANNYYAERKVRQINKLQKELKEIKYEHISTKSRLMQLSKQSQIAKKTENSRLRESVEPVKVIREKETKPSK